MASGLADVLILCLATGSLCRSKVELDRVLQYFGERLEASMFALQSWKAVWTSCRETVCVAVEIEEVEFAAASLTGTHVVVRCSLFAKENLPARDFFRIHYYLPLPLSRVTFRQLAWN